MAKAQGYVSEYEAALAQYQKSIEDYNKSIDDFNNSLYQGGIIVDSAGPGVDLGGGYYSTLIENFGMVGRKPIGSYQGKIEQLQFQDDAGRNQAAFAVIDPTTGLQALFPLNDGNDPDAIYTRVSQLNNNLIAFRDGRIMQFSPEPGDFTGTPPTFDQTLYTSLLKEDYDTEVAATSALFQAEQAKLRDQVLAEQKAIQDAFQKAQAEEQARFAQEKAEQEAAQAKLAEEARLAEEQAKKNLELAQADAAEAEVTRQRKQKQFRDETDELQRNVGARRSAYVRARRMRGRSLLSGA